MQLWDTFNRTLWNWNILEIGDADSEWKLLIEPYGIEIFIDFL